MTLHDPSFVGPEEPWENGPLDLERRFRLGSEVTSLSRSSSSDKNDGLDNLSLGLRLNSSVRSDPDADLATTHGLPDEHE